MIQWVLVVQTEPPTPQPTEQAEAAGRVQMFLFCPGRVSILSLLALRNVKNSSLIIASTIPLL